MHTATRPLAYVKGLAGDLFSLFFPHCCVSCNQGLARGERILCVPCINELPYLDQVPLSDDWLLDRFAGRLNLREAMSLLVFRKQGITQKLLHQLKYRGKGDIGEQLGRLIGNKILEWTWLDMIVPVPLHKGKIRQRGYNQSMLLAKGISEATHVSYEEGLKRIKNNQSQTKRGNWERWQNVKDVFVVDNPSVVKDKHVLLVDDVITTGATLEACGTSLLAAGCASLSIASAAFTVR